MARLPPQFPAQQLQHFARLCVPAGSQLGVHQRAVQSDLVYAAGCGQQPHGFQLRFKLRQNLDHQTGGPFCKASRGTVTYFNDMLHTNSVAKYNSKLRRKNTAIVLTLTRCFGTTEYSQRQ